MVTYVDPQIFNRKRDSNNKVQIYSLNKKSDIYSIGVLLWEISSRKLPFHEENYDFSLMYKISQGRREVIIFDTPIDYSNLYTGKLYFTILFIYLFSILIILIKSILLIIKVLE